MTTTVIKPIINVVSFEATVLVTTYVRQGEIYASGGNVYLIVCPGGHELAIVNLATGVTISKSRDALPRPESFQLITGRILIQRDPSTL